MIDIRVAIIKDILPYVSAEKVLDDPPTLEIRGRNFLRATAVYMNNVKAPEMVIFSDEHLWAQIPRAQASEVITSLMVISETLSMGKQSLVHFELNDFRRVSGVQKLCQYFIKLLLQSPGSDIFAKDIGGGLLKMIGQNDAFNDGKSVRTAILDAINRVKSYIVKEQGPDGSIPLDERLLDITINGVSFDETRTEITVNITLTSMAGSQATTNLQF
jgi:hypothetical protein